MLGFSNLVYADKLDFINEYYQTILTDFKSSALSKNLEYLLISDSIVVYADLEKENFFTVSKVLSVLQSRLFIKGILVRGGISFGKLFVDKKDNIVVGPGLINAYKLEGLAQYPRIIIDRKLIKLYWANTTSFVDDHGKIIRAESFSTYPNDYPFIDYAFSLALNMKADVFSRIIEVLDTGYYGNEHVTKYEWIKCLINSSFTISLEYLNSKEIKSKNEIKRIKLLNNFMTNFKSL